MERKYFVATPGGKSMEAIIAWQKISAEAWAKAEKIIEELGAGPNLLKTSFGIAGLCFEKDPGKAWKPVRGYGEGIYYPDKRIKEGKDIAKRLKEIEFPGSRTFASLIGGGFFIISGNRWGSISFEEIGDAYIISIPIGKQEQSSDASFVPPDTLPLKLSEYYALKEAEADKEAPA
jgi:hypothetical protein